LAEHMDEPLAQYLALHSSPVLRKHASQWAVGSASFKLPVLQHLASTHALYQRWQTDKVVRGDPARFQAEKTRALDYVKKHKDAICGWCMLCLLEDRAADRRVPRPGSKSGETQPDRDFYAELADAWALFADSPSLGYAARYEQARCLLRAAKTAE